MDVRTAGAGAVGALAVGVLAHRELRRRIRRDPNNAALRSPAVGRSGVVRSADGTELHIEQFGPQSAPTVVLVHGWTEQVAYWTSVVSALVEHRTHVVVYDLRGHGQSRRAAGGDYAAERFGEDLDAVLRAVLPEGKRAVLAGHSLGAISIAAWAEHHDAQEAASAAVFINAGVGNLIAEALLMPVPAVARVTNRLVGARGSVGLRTPLPRFSTPISHAAIRYAAFGPAATPAQVAFFERMLLAMPPDVRAEVGLAISEVDLHHALAQLNVPTTVIAGSRDRLTPPSHALRIADAVPELYRLTVLDGIGHMAPLERPQVVVESLLELTAVTPSVPAGTA